MDSSHAKRRPRKRAIAILVAVVSLVLVGLLLSQQVAVQNGTSLSTLSLSATTGGGVVTIQPSSGSGTYTFGLPTAAGTAGQPLLSGGGAAMSYGTNTGTATEFATANGTFTGHTGEEVTVASTGDLQTSGIVPGTVSTAQQGGLFFPSVGWPLVGGTASNHPDMPTRFMQFTSPYKIVIGRASVFVNTASATGHFLVGIYDVTGATKLGQSSIPCGSTNNATATNTLGTSVTLQPGTVYLVVWGNTDATCTVQGEGNANYFAMQNSNGASRIGTAGNASGTSLPSAPLTLTATITNVNIPYVLFEP